MQCNNPTWNYRVTTLSKRINSQRHLTLQCLSGVLFPRSVHQKFNSTPFFFFQNPNLEIESLTYNVVQECEKKN